MKQLLVNRQQYLRLPSPARDNLKAKGAGQHQVSLDDKTFYQLTSADRITE
ncbi:hypothetical protein [Aeromonas veronii]|uniref:hypothetical protein n=1 Tax=Aeromonas veronii TaxID=654 RepID=UPI001F3F06B4|nr:hypothetical protein [Aeromonas veronii]MCF5913923.1 hypothetical protein [Aeromonas veronii]